MGLSIDKRVTLGFRFGTAIVINSVTNVPSTTNVHNMTNYQVLWIGKPENLKIFELCSDKYKNLCSCFFFFLVRNDPSKEIFFIKILKYFDQ